MPACTCVSCTAPNPCTAYRGCCTVRVRPELHYIADMGWDLYQSGVHTIPDYAASKCKLPRIKGARDAHFTGWLHASVVAFNASNSASLTLF